MSVETRKVATKKGLKTFIKFPYELYKGCDNWVPALVGDMFDTFNPKKNGAYEFCESELYLAYKDGEVAGRVAAIINHNANKTRGEEIVRFGWIDFVEDIDVLRALIDAVQKWGKSKGCTICKGPWGFTDMDPEGLLVEGFEHLGPFTCSYNYPYYDTLLKELGFSKDVDWTLRLVDIPDHPTPSMEYAPLVEKKYGLHMAYAKNTRELCDKYGMAIFHMYNETFAPLFNFSPITDKQIKAYLKTYVPILDKDYVAVLLDRQDTPVGFAFCVPTLSKAVKKSNGYLFPFGFLRMFRALRHNDTLEALMIGILPEYQGKGGSILLFKYIQDSCMRRGIKKMILNPQLESNFKVQSMYSEYTTHDFMRRRAYTKPIE